MKARRFLNLMMASLVAMAYTSCSNSDDVIDTPDPIVKTYTMTVDAQKGSNGTRALSLEGNTLNSTWTAGETVKVYKDNAELGTLTAQSTGANTSLKGTLSGDLYVNDNLTLKYLSADYNSQDGTLTGTAKSIDKVCDYSTATVTVSGIAGGNISTTNANFVNQQAVIKFTLKDADGNAFASNPTSFRMTDGTSTVTLSDIPDETYTTNGTGVLYVAFPATGESATITLSATVSGVLYGLAKTDITFTNSKYYGVTVKMKAGKFSVSDSKQVYFSKGNLQYIGSASTPYWKFADHQYDYLGTTTSQNSSTENVDRDLFGWGTSGSAPSDQTARAPYYTTATNANYVSNITTTETSWGVGSQWDWGHNAISNGGNTADAWRTLTKDEWLYLFGMESNNTDKSDHARYRKYFRATVNGVIGIVVLPDDISGISDIPEESSRGTASAFDGKTYTTDAWATLEGKGCVFLPAAGYRNVTSVSGVGSDGRYWSSTANGKGASRAYNVFFNSGYVYPAGNGNRGIGFSVRLVRPVE